MIEFSEDDPAKIYLSALQCGKSQLVNFRNKDLILFPLGIETLLSGGTCVMDHLSLIPDKEIECIQQAVKAYQEVCRSILK